MRRRLLITAAVVLVPVAVLAVEVIVARTGNRLADETGFRPRGLTVRPGPDPTAVVWLGDSTATGVGTDTVEASMAYRVAADITTGPATVSILAVSGAQVHDVVEDQLPQLADVVASGDGADVVLVAVGANDVTGLTRRPTFRSRYRSMVDEIAALAPGAEIVLVGVPAMGTAPRLPVPLRQITGFRAAQLDGVIAGIAGNRGLTHVDLADRTGAVFASDPDRYFSADNFHPGPDGHRVWADAVAAATAEAATLRHTG